LDPPRTHGKMKVLGPKTMGDITKPLKMKAVVVSYISRTSPVTFSMAPNCFSGRRAVHGDANFMRK